MKKLTTLFDAFLNACEKYKKNIAFEYKLNDKQIEVTYEKLRRDVLLLSRAFGSKGIKKGSKVLFVCDNRYEWIVTDFALISLGAISIPKGSDTCATELEFLTNHSESTFLILESKNLYLKYKTQLNTLKLKSIFIIESKNIHTVFDNVYSYLDLLKNREISDDDIDNFLELKKRITKDNVYTIMYTSGTTGTPKGVTLTHQNVMYNINVIPKLIDLKNSDTWLSILPTWHIFERTAEHLSVANGCKLVYSSIKTFGSDLQEYRPTLVATVPRLWESMYIKINSTLEKQNPRKAKIFKKLVKISTLYNHNLRVIKDELPMFKKEKILSTCKKKTFAFLKLVPLYLPNILAKKKLKGVRDKFGGNLRLAVSAGGTLPDYLDAWIDAVGIRIVNAYGMTECAPAIAGRALNCNTFSTLGPPTKGTDLRIIGDLGENLTCGKIGEIILKGEQVTPGYYKNEDENKKSFTKDGYFKTGDLGKLTLRGELVITGRSKEIIILANGENVDPSRIESTISMLPFISDNMLVGQDKRGLGMLVVPDFEKLKEYVFKNFNRVLHNIEQLGDDMLIKNGIKKDMNKLLNHKKGFKAFEKLQNIHFLQEEFKIGDELTNTFKKKRHLIEKKYQKIIDSFLK